jgi:acyl-coenzyme A thioesterase PaaI-like protein
MAGLPETMLDSCMGLAIQSMLEKGFGSTTLEFKISFIRPIAPGTGLITAEGKVISSGRRVGNSRRSCHRQPGTLAGPWDDDLPDLREPVMSLTGTSPS